MINVIIEDAIFAAIAAIGFAAISNPPKNAYACCAAIAALGHSVRFALMHEAICGLSIVPASAIAAFAIGFMSVIFSSCAKIPAETFLFPSLLPMIPGIYAYKSFGGLVMCLLHSGESAFSHYFYLFAYNGLTCGCIIAGMVLGANIPIFLMKKMAFSATR